MRKNVAGAAGAERFLRRAAVDAAIVIIAAGLFLSLWASDRAAAGARRGGKSAAVFAPNGDGSVYLGRAKDSAALVCTLSWNAGGLETILDSLEKHGVKITFAVTRRWAEENEATLKRIAASGHEIALAAEAEGYGEALSELARAAELAEKASGVRPELFICGNASARRAARSLSLLPVMGTVDLICVRGSPEELLNRARCSVRGGDIVLTSPSAAFSKAADDILGYYSLMGLTITTVSGTIYD